ncbi:MAG: sulfotransferase [Bacteroidales bacterium]|nr:sulfotransferase [Bacteroidales bacterium]
MKIYREATDTYRNSLSNVYNDLYEKILSKNGKQYFLDKTPRYYLIIKELYEYFPEAKFIFLWRNPAAVITSVINTWDTWYKLSEFRYDLLDALDLMQKGRDIVGDNGLSIYYEEILREPKKQVQAICDHIGIPFEEDIIEYNQELKDKWIHGDQGTVYEKNHPDFAHADKWISSLNHPQIWRIVNDYINHLGNKKLQDIGYSYEQITLILQSNKPSININKHSISFFSLIDDTQHQLIDNRSMRESIRQKNQLLKERDEQLKQRDEQLRQKDEQIKQRDEQLIINKSEIDKKNNELKTVYNSYTLKIGHIISWPLKKVIGK